MIAKIGETANNLHKKRRPWGKPKRRFPYTKANCMGYALGIKKWLLPEEDYRQSAEVVIPSLIAEYNLTPVSRPSMQLGRKYVAYKFSNQDFHWAVRDEKGHWRHKTGSRPSEAISEKKVFAKVWQSGSQYTSKTYLFELQQ